MVYRVFHTSGNPIEMPLGPRTIRSLLENAIGSYANNHENNHPSIEQLTDYANDLYLGEGIRFYPDDVRIFVESSVATHGRLGNGRNMGSMLILDKGRYHHRAFTLDYDTHEIITSDTTQKITATELRLLHVLKINAGTFVPMGHIIGTVWGWDSVADTENVRTLVSLLRKKLGDANQSIIVNRPGVGYMLIK